MIVKTQGIVLHKLSYKESSIIVRIFTRDFGLRSYIVNGVKSKKSSKIALYQPFTILDLTVYEKPNSDLNRISEASTSFPQVNLMAQVVKSAMAIFLADCTLKILQKEKEENNLLFDFILHNILALNEESRISEFHIRYLFEMTGHIGLDIIGPEQFNRELDDLGFYKLNMNTNDWESLLLIRNYENPNISSEQRRKLLDMLLNYFTRVNEKVNDPTSLDVLHTLLHD